MNKERLRVFMNNGAVLKVVINEKEFEKMGDLLYGKLHEGRIPYKKIAINMENVSYIILDDA